MPLVVISTPVTNFVEIFEPGYISGEHGVVNPLTGAEWGAYGLTVDDARRRSEELARLWTTERSYGSGLSLRRRHKAVPEGEGTRE